MTADLLMMLLDASIRSVAVGAIVALLLVALRVQSGSARHAAWTSVMCGMLLMPVLQQWVPSMAIPVPRWQVETTATPPPSTTDGLRRDIGAVPVAIGGETRRATAVEPRLLGAEAARNPEVQWLPGLSWGIFLAVVYVLGVLVLLARLLLGWRAARRLARASHPITLSGSHAWLDIGRRMLVSESSLVTTPVTLGVVAPVIILPATWRSWPAWNLRAVLAHERAHVCRRDPLVGFIARVNCCLFWFHPLAWWLQRELAVSAEQASDDQAVREVGEAERYAQVLLEMAAAVRLHGGRLVWQGVGIDGSGFLGQRIDRLLRQGLFRELSRIRKVTLAVSCAAAVLVAAACRQQPAVTALREDPQIAERLAQQKASQDRYAKAQAMTTAEVDQLEASLRTNPEDFDARQTLQMFYQSSGQKVLGWNEMIARRRPLILWLIQRHPEHERAVWKIAPAGDPVGYAEAKKAWLAQTSKSNTPVIVLDHAARFFADDDPSIAEQMLLRAKDLEPNDVKWSGRLGSFYGRVIVGPRSPRDGSPLTPLDSNPYARQVRLRTLESQDARLLDAAGSELFRTYRDPERRDLGKRLLERSLEMNPQSPNTGLRLTHAQEQEQKDRVGAVIRAKRAQLAGPEIARKLDAGERLTEEESVQFRNVEYEAVATAPISEEDRLLALVDLADSAYMGAEARSFTQKDEAGAKASFDRSKQAAERALELASKFRNSPNYGVVVYRATIALGTHALREGDRRTAVRLMLDAVKAPASERLAQQDVSLDARLVNYLLKEGERESVAQFLEASAGLRTSERDRLLRDATAIREGRMPMAYQYMVTPH